MLDRALKPHKNSSTSENSWIVICAIPTIIAVIALIERHIRSLYHPLGSAEVIKMHSGRCLSLGARKPMKHRGCCAHLVPVPKGC